MIIIIKKPHKSHHILSERVLKTNETQWILFCLFSNMFHLHWLSSLPLFQRQKSRNQTSLSKEPSGWRTQACSRSPSDQQKSTDKRVKDMDSKFSTVKNLHLSQTLQKTSSYCKWTNVLFLFVRAYFAVSNVDLQFEEQLGIKIWVLHGNLVCVCSPHHPQALLILILSLSGCVSPQ